MDTYGDAGLGLLADPSRRAIFELLARRPCSVGELAQQLPISRPAVSQHLRVLKDGGLVVSRPEGTRRLYRLNPDGVTALRAWLDRVWDESLTAFQKAAEAAPVDTEQEHTMTSAPPIPAVHAKITVGAPVEHAFRVFTESFHTWWPTGYHIGQAEMAEAVLEPRAGGRWYERGVDGSECDWGRVLAWEPPHRLVLTWQINGEWRYDADPEHASEVEVRFTADGPEQTTVELEHRHLDRLPDGQAMRDAVGGDRGWAGILERYREAAAAY
ncbi:MAG: metalloregulator ArsR/SmtB family transcription factor [bacterium]